MKYGEKKLWEEIHTLIEVIWESEKMPDMANCNDMPHTQEGR
jgi:hypothetical protein